MPIFAPDLGLLEPTRGEAGESGGVGAGAAGGVAEGKSELTPADAGAVGIGGAGAASTPQVPPTNSSFLVLNSVRLDKLYYAGRRAE